MPWVRAGRALPKSAQSRMRKAGRDLGQLLGDLPDSSLSRDWADLCGVMARGVALDPKEALGALNKTLAAIRHLGNARVWLVGSSASQKALTQEVDRTLTSLDASAAPSAPPTPHRRLLERARTRGVKEDSPFVALVNPNTGSASLVHTARSLGLDETHADALIDYLALNTFGGNGTQSFYKRIWGQALAYSGYVSAWPDDERATLYADRSADLPQLLRFVDAEVRRAPVDERFVDYAIAATLSSRGAYTFETRARGIASDLAEGRTPDRVRAFHARLLALRARPRLAEELHAHFVPAMSALIPSLAAGSALPIDAVYFTVGPEPQIAGYEREMRHAVSAGVNVVRLWPRDFWDAAGDLPRE
jgi:hypothetical protein